MKISKGLADIRHEYVLKSLSRSTVDRDPFAQFAAWMNEALAAEILEPSAMTLATVDDHRRPSVRVVLLKGFDENGFVFFTNYESRKARDLDLNPKAAIHFFWPEVERQIAIAGTVKKTSKEESEIYFRSRPFASRIGAWASNQSAVVESRKALEEQFDRLLAKYPDGDVPLPPFWGGFRLTPANFEFWQGRKSRLHDRICYELDGQVWNIFRRSP